MAHFLIYLLVWLNPNQSNRMSAAQWCFPLQSKWGFSGITVKRKLLQGLLVSIRELQFAPVERHLLKSEFSGTAWVWPDLAKNIQAFYAVFGLILNHFLLLGKFSWWKVNGQILSK